AAGAAERLREEACFGQLVGREVVLAAREADAVGRREEVRRVRRRARLPAARAVTRVGARRRALEHEADRTAATAAARLSSGGITRRESGEHGPADALRVPFEAREVVGWTVLPDLPA